MIQQTSQSEQIAAFIDLEALSLFGCHVVGSTNDGTDCCQAGFAAGQAGQAEIHDAHAITVRLQPDVVGFDVAMQQTALMRCVQARRDLSADSQHFVCWQTAFALQSCGQGFPFEQLHREERQSAFFSHVIDCHDVIMFKHSRRLGFPAKSSTGDSTGRQNRIQNLDGPLPVKFPIFGSKHDSHASLAKVFEDTEAAEPTDFVGFFGRREQRADINLIIRCRLITEANFQLLQSGNEVCDFLRQGGFQVEGGIRVVSTQRDRQPILLGQRLNRGQTVWAIRNV